jgi:hypothetical protein
VKSRTAGLAFLALVFGAIGGSAHRAENRPRLKQGAPASTAGRSPVVIELFTSEGCSSCPPADSFLSELQAKQPVPGVEIIALEEHVDYWNHDGWQDPFSGREWTERQQEYVIKFKGATPYTPQLILNGERVLQLKSGTEIAQNILQAAKEERTEVSIAAAPDENDTEKVEIRVGNLRGVNDQDKADIWMAVTELGLHSDVKAGENSGRTLEHSPVVRSLQKVGSVAAKNAAPFAASSQLKLKASWKKENLSLVVFVQDHKSWRILGAASAKLSG